MYLYDQPIVRLARRKRHMSVQEFNDWIEKEVGTLDEETVLPWLQRHMYANVDQLTKYQGVLVYKGDLYDRSIFAEGTPYWASENAANKCELQNAMWSMIRASVDENIANGMTNRSILNMYRWLRMTEIGYLQGMPKLYESTGLTLLDPEDIMHYEKFLVRTAKWLYYCITRYIEQEYSNNRKDRASHMEHSRLYNAVIDGVPWNPVMFRRYVPFQFLNKLGTYKYNYHSCTPINSNDLLDFMNTTIQVQQYVSEDIDKSAKMCIARYSSSYITADEVRAKGYSEDADLFDSFGAFQIVKMAIVYFERSIVVRDAVHGIDVTGRLKYINDTVASMRPWDIEAYLERVYTANWSEDTVWFKDGEWRRLNSGLF